MIFKLSNNKKCFDMKERILHSVGDKVIALTNPKTRVCQPRIKGETYVVDQISYCNKCGDQRINIGISKVTESNLIICNCGSEQFNEGLAWTNSKHFANLKELNTILKKLENAEEYEICANVRDIMKEKTT